MPQFGSTRILGDLTITGNATLNGSGLLTVANFISLMGEYDDTHTHAYLASNHDASAVTSAKIGFWDTAYGWGNHASTYLLLTGGTITGSVGINDNLTIGVYSTTDTGIIYLTGSTANKQGTMKVTNGNMHLDAAAGAYAMYLNYYDGTGGVIFGNGAGGSNASVSASGVFTASGGDSGEWNTAYTHSGVAHAPSGAEAHIAPTIAEVKAVLNVNNMILSIGGPSTSNEAEIIIDTNNDGSPQIGFTEHGDMSWAIGGDDADNSFKIHGVASGVIPTINNLAIPHFEITTAGLIYAGTDLMYHAGNLTVGDGGLTQKNFTTTLKTKLDGIATGATNTSVPYYTSAIAVGDGGLTQKNFTTTLKTKLDGIATGATNTSAPYYTSIIPAGSAATRGGAKFDYNSGTGVLIIDLT